MAALFRINRMTGTSQTYTRSNKCPRANIYRRCIQNNTVVIDYNQTMCMDIESVITMKIRFNACHL